MFGISGSVKIYYCPTPINLRKSFDGLAGAVEEYIKVSAQPAPSGFEADSVVCSSTNRNNGRTAWDGKDEIIGRRNCQIPKEAHGSVNLDRFTSSGRIITDAMMKLFDRRVDPNLLVRRITVVAAHVLNEKDIPAAPEEQPDLFADYEALKKRKRRNRRSWTRRSVFSRQFSTSKNVWERMPSSRA